MTEPVSPTLPRKFGQYVIEQQIGRGESSRVYRAHHDDIPDHKVALKVLLTQEGARIRRFRREVEIAARLRHPHISRFYNFGVQNPFYYAVFEYIPGKALRDLIQEPDQRLPPDRALRWFRQIADALDYAHSQHIIHRDLSPGNILIDPDTDRAYLIDFGIAREPEQSLTATGTIMGTSGFIAPEGLVSAKDVTHLADIFSLGVILFFMLTGELPWQRELKPEELIKRGYGRARSLADMGVKLPGEVERIIQTMLALEPSHRYASAGAAALELEAVLSRHLSATQIITERAGDREAMNRQQRALVMIEPNDVEQCLSGSLFHAPLERALRRARELNSAKIAELLNQWSQANRLRRPLLGRLARIHDLVHHNVFFFRLQLLIEQRRDAGVDEEPDAQQKQIVPQRELDRWQVPLPEPKEFKNHPGGRVLVPGSERVALCDSCKGRGVIACPTCQGQGRVKVPEPAPAQDGADKGAAQHSPVNRERIIPCTACNGRGSLPCKRCESFGRVIQRKLIEWSRSVERGEIHNDLPDVDESWLRKTCKAELVYHQTYRAIPNSWLQIGDLKQLIEQFQKELDPDSRIVLAELKIHFIPLTEVWLDLGNPEQLYRVPIYGFENLIPPDWRLLHWERILSLSAIGLLAVLLIISLAFLAM